ncbi:hypothetical protein [Acidovorax cavernicola]|uniref:Uncharacterized protein n=1 Tax=Acidovorax cavernicola TaxID=1675792 RepID=A0A9X8D9Z7_9BURK|nr:hypothetical protein [Acidovorax cavernicola]RIX85194.1 hypothetical protein D3H34_01265 [Acidovorax cavernicola]
MGIALLAIADIWSPLQSLATRWMPARRSSRGDSSDAAAGLRYVAVRPACTARTAGSPAPTTSPSAATPARPLRVVRVVDRQGSQRGCANRVVISGRMADVCAELDRLAALEAAETGSGTPRPSCLH